MSARRKSTIRAVWLGEELKKMRTEAGLSVRELGGLLGLHQANVSKLENGLYPAGRHHVESYVRFCGVDDPQRQDTVFTICRDVLRKGWWDGYVEEVASGLMDRIWMESKATVIKSFEPTVIPGLLQTPAYARTIMQAADPEARAEDIDQWLEVRTQRQLVINRHDPVVFDGIIDESAIRRALVDRTVGLPQIQFLAEASRRQNITLRLLPESAGLHPSTSGGFEILTLAEPYPEAGLLTAVETELCVEGGEVQSLKQKYASLQELCLSPKQSRLRLLSELDE